MLYGICPLTLIRLFGSFPSLWAVCLPLGTILKEAKKWTVLISFIVHLILSVSIVEAKNKAPSSFCAVSVYQKNSSERSDKLKSGGRCALNRARIHKKRNNSEVIPPFLRAITGWRHEKLPVASPVWRLWQVFLTRVCVIYVWCNDIISNCLWCSSCSRSPSIQVDGAFLRLSGLSHASWCVKSVLIMSNNDNDGDDNDQVIIVIGHYSFWKGRWADSVSNSDRLLT